MLPYTCGALDHVRETREPREMVAEMEEKREERMFLCITRTSTYHRIKATVRMLQVQSCRKLSCILYKTAQLQCLSKQSQASLDSTNAVGSMSATKPKKIKHSLWK